MFSLQGESFKLGSRVWSVADGLQDAPVPVQVLLLLLFPLTRSRLQLCLAPRLDKEKEWTSKKIGFRLSDYLNHNS